MNYSHNQPGSPLYQANAVRTYIRNGWIPIVIQVQDRENRSQQEEHQPGYNRPRKRNMKRKWSWITWPWK